MVMAADTPVLRSLSLITDVHVRQWGGEVEIEGLDDPITRQPTRLIYRDCREIRWSIYDGEASETEADVIGFCPGLSEYLEPAVITTDLFELSILYRSCEVEPTQVPFENIGEQKSAVEQ